MAQVEEIDSGWRALMTLFGKRLPGVARVGVLEGVLSPSSAAIPGFSAKHTQIAEYAAHNEFGTATIPARPFIATTVRENREKYEKMFALGASEVFQGRMKPTQVLNEVGLAAVKDMRKTVTNARRWAVPNAPSTVARKTRRNKRARIVTPLIDTGAMRNAIWYDIRDEPGGLGEIFSG